MTEKKKVTRKKKVDKSLTTFAFNPNRRCINCTHNGVIIEKTNETGCKLASSICINESERTYFEERSI